MKPYYRYVDNVLGGKIVCGENIKLACKRFKADLQRTDLVLKEEVIDKAISFIGTLRHFTGKHSGKPFILEDWQ